MTDKKKPLPQKWFWVLLGMAIFVLIDLGYIVSSLVHGHDHLTISHYLMFGVQPLIWWAIIAIHKEIFVVKAERSEGGEATTKKP